MDGEEDPIGLLFYSMAFVHLGLAHEDEGDDISYGIGGEECKDDIDHIR